MRRYGFAPLALALVLLVHRLELCAVAVRQTGALVGAHQRPVLVGLHALHEQVGDPQCIKEVARTVLFGSRVQLHLQKLLDVRVPRLEVDGETAVALPALVDVARRVIVDLEHRDNTRRLSTGAVDLRVSRANVVDGQTHTTGPLGNLGAVAERLVYTLDRILLHVDEEAG